MEYLLFGRVFMLSPSDGQNLKVRTVYYENQNKRLLTLWRGEYITTSTWSVLSSSSPNMPSWPPLPLANNIMAMSTTLRDFEKMLITEILIYNLLISRNY